MQQLRRSPSQPPGPAAAAAADIAFPAAAAATTSSASSNTQHSNSGASTVIKRPAAAQHVPFGKSKRPRYTAALLPVAYAAASSSSSSSSSTDDSDDTAVSRAAPLTLLEAEQLCAAVKAGEQNLQSVLLQLLYSKGEPAFISYIRYTLQQELQQQQQQGGTPGLLNTLLADNCSLLTELLQTLSHPNIVTCYNAAIAFQGLADLAGADQVLAAVLAAPQGVLLLLAALNESRLRMAYHQGFVITVCYSGRAVQEPLCSGTVGCMIKCARKQDLENLIRQLLPVLTWNDESAVAAAMSLVIIARNAESGIELLLPHISLLLAAVHQHWRVSKRVLLTLRIMAETAAAAASPFVSVSAGPVAAAAVPGPMAAAAAMAQADLKPLVNLVLHGTQESAALAADIILTLFRSVPDHHGLLNLVPDLVQGYQYLGPVSWHAVQAVQILRQITAGSTAGAAAVLPHIGSILALQFVVAIPPEIAEVQSKIQQQQQQQQQQQVPELQLIVTAESHTVLVNQTLRQLAAELAADLAAKPAAAAVISQQQHARLLLRALQQQLLLDQQHQITGDQFNVIVRSLLGTVRCLAATRSGQFALADHECIELLFQIMQQDLDQELSRSPGVQGFTDTALEVLLRLIMAAAVGGLRSPALGRAAAAAAGAAEQQAPTTVYHLAGGSTADLATTAAGGGIAGPVVTAAGAVDPSTIYSTQLADLLIAALKPDQIKLLINIGQNPSFSVRVLHCLIPLCKFPGGFGLLAPHASDMLQIVRGILPATVGEGDRYLDTLVATAEAVVRGIVGRQLHQQQQQQ